MGLGKTIQTLSLFAYLKETTDVSGPHLVVAPVSVIQNWANEIQRFTPQLSFCRISGGREERDLALAEPEILYGLRDIYLTTYEVISIEEAFFADAKFRWATMTIDEGHRLKNEKSILSASLARIESPFRLLLTGTPIQNNLHELWSLMSYLLPELFTDSTRFDSGFSGEMLDRELCKQASELLEECCMLRRLKSDVEKTLLPKIQCKLYVPLTALQRRWYKRALMRDATAASDTISLARLYSVLTQLIRVCNHPKQILMKREDLREKARKRAAALSDSATPTTREPLTADILAAEEELRGLVGDALIKSAGKLALLDRLLLRLHKQGSRVLIFSQVI